MVTGQGHALECAPKTAMPCECIYVAAQHKACHHADTYMHTTGVKEVKYEPGSKSGLGCICDGVPHDCTVNIA